MAHKHVVIYRSVTVPMDHRGITRVSSGIGITLFLHTIESSLFQECGDLSENLT